MTKKNQSWWTKERVRNGLARFVRDYYAEPGREAELPGNWHAYRIAIPAADRRHAQRFRLYPPFQVVARHYDSILEAWRELGYEVEERSAEWWSRERVIQGLRLFFEDFGCCPTDHREYCKRQQFTGKINENGKLSRKGYDHKYPSIYGVFKHFRSMREAWTTAGFDVDQGWEPWSELEDWFILESVGILPREEVAEVIKRTVPAIKRRLYDLGRVNSKNRWGLSVNRAGSLLGIGGHVITKYLDYGFIPYFKGNKVIYLNPADLVRIGEIDWSATVHPELETMIKKALIQRVMKILTYRENWSAHEIYQFHKKKEYYAGKIKNPRRSAFANEIPEPPNDLQTGQWVTLKVRVRMVAENRKGVIKAVFYSPPRHPRADGTKRSCWIANVEFPKIKRFTPDESENRVRYNLPLDVLEKSAPPEIEPKPLKQTPEAVRSRRRRAIYEHRAGNRFQSIKSKLT